MPALQTMRIFPSNLHIQLKLEGGIKTIWPFALWSPTEQIAAGFGQLSDWLLSTEEHIFPLFSPAQLAGAPRGVSLSGETTPDSWAAVCMCVCVSRILCIVNVYLSRPLKHIRPNLTARVQTAMLQDSDHLNARRPAGRKLRCLKKRVEEEKKDTQKGRQRVDLRTPLYYMRDRLPFSCEEYCSLVNLARASRIAAGPAEPHWGARGVPSGAHLEGDRNGWSEEFPQKDRSRGKR